MMVIGVRVLLNSQPQLGVALTIHHPQTLKAQLVGNTEIAAANVGRTLMAFHRYRYSFKTNFMA